MIEALDVRLLVTEDDLKEADAVDAERAEDEPLGPTAVAKGLGHSSGAVGNCLKRLAAAGRVNQTGERPQRYAAANEARAQ